MINLENELLNFKNIDLAALIEKNYEFSDSVKNSIILYNKALDNLHFKSEDISIIELKKAISINPDFTEAMLLLTLCYIYVNDFLKARTILNKVLASDKDNVKALEYKELIEKGNAYFEKHPKPLPKKELPSNSISKNKPNSQTKVRTVSMKTRRRIFKTILAFLLISAILCSIWAFFVYYRNNNNSILSPNNAPNDNKQNTIKPSQIILPSITGIVYSPTPSEIKPVTTPQESNISSKELDYYKSVATLLEIENLSIQDKLEEAADNLFKLKNVDFKGVEKAKYDALTELIMPKASQIIYDSGNKLLNSGKYNEALPIYDKIFLYYDKWKYLDAVLYKRVRCYVGLQNLDKAKEILEKLKNLYPQSSYIDIATSRIASPQE